MVTVIGGEEEHFEDFGESNTSELLLESIVEVTEAQVDSPLVKTPEQVNGSSLLSPRYKLQVLCCSNQSKSNKFTFKHKNVVLHAVNLEIK